MRKAGLLTLVLLLVGGAAAIALLVFKQNPSPQSHRSYALEVTASPEGAAPFGRVAYAFRVKDDRGEVIKDFETVHEKIMHLIVVRKDLAEFQHVHPEFDSGSGEFRISDLTFPSDGEYRLFSDFTPKNSQKGPDGEPLAVTLSSDARIGDLGRYQAQPVVPDQAFEKTVDGNPVAFATDPVTPEAGKETTLVYSIIDPATGQPTEKLQPYLGALGHVVVLKEGTLDFIHAHPEEMSAGGGHGAHQASTVFKTTFPSDGNYRIFGQFNIGGKVITTVYTVGVGQAQSAQVQSSVREILIAARRYAFSPNSIQVRRGERVRIRVNNADYPHGMIAPDLLAPPDQPDKTVLEFTATEPGQYRFFCSDYGCNCNGAACTQGHQQMIGTVTVT
jgi:plastocyanin